MTRLSVLLFAACASAPVAKSSAPVQPTGSLQLVWSTHADAADNGLHASLAVDGDNIDIGWVGNANATCAPKAADKVRSDFACSESEVWTTAAIEAGALVVTYHDDAGDHEMLRKPTAARELVVR
jgi:hypothetical protein